MKKKITLEYEPITSETKPIIRGKIEGLPPGHFLITMRNGPGPLGGIKTIFGGKFWVDVGLYLNKKNYFSISVKSINGEIIQVEPDSFEIVHEDKKQYEFDELSDEVKEKILNEYHDINVPKGWENTYYQEFDNIASGYGIMLNDGEEIENVALSSLYRVEEDLGRHCRFNADVDLDEFLDRIRKFDLFSAEENEVLKDSYDYAGRIAIKCDPTKHSMYVEFKDFEFHQNDDLLLVKRLQQKIKTILEVVANMLGQQLNYDIRTEYRSRIHPDNVQKKIESRYNLFKKDGTKT